LDIPTKTMFQEIPQPQGWREFWRFLTRPALWVTKRAGCKSSTGTSLSGHIGSRRSRVMKTNTKNEPLARRSPPRGHTPLPQRWRRARKWAEAHHLETPNMPFLKEMLAQELRGKG
jgi:hypothetical protein